MSSVILLLALLMSHVLGSFYSPSVARGTQFNAALLNQPRLYIRILLSPILMMTCFISQEVTWGFALLSAVIIAMMNIGALRLNLIEPQRTRYFIAIQACYLCVLIMIWCMAIGVTCADAWLWIDEHCKREWIVGAAAYLVIAQPASKLIALILKIAPLEVGADNQGNTPRLAFSAGEAIGILERFLILTFVLLNEFSGVGFLLAAKSVFRFGDLNDAHSKTMTEYVMLGTLLSVSIALAAGLAAQYLMAQV
ncbi:hypothetical protein [Echinimonas agarilytica]|uniref:DUF3307 domain-containing protein n=1 Tax=Echinimonas agarilytica TaxID=1215918 RepID=A0AA41W7S2_9GAMM|nr:hypothetical protein [Echinimonas agarilytica]MCM2680465.1 hypothetical protein [Echinimonas agarilytica]